MKQFKAILFATDFSEASEPASEYAISLTKRTGAHLHILHVINELEEHQRVMIPQEMGEGSGDHLPRRRRGGLPQNPGSRRCRQS